MSLDYFPNELKFSERFTNTDLEQILMSKHSNSKDYSYAEICELFRAMTLCNQVYLIKDKDQQRLKERQFKYIGVMPDEISVIEFAYQQGFKLLHRKNKLL
jgi:magnesium-transporting ATPase (P-type)